MRIVHRRILGLVAVVIVITVLGLLAQQFASLEWLITQEGNLRDLVRTFPIASWLSGFVVYIGLSLVPGTSGKSVIFGWLFGFWSAVLMVDIALTVAAVATFCISRVLFRESIEARFGVHLVHFRHKLESSAGFYLLMLRLAHAPFSWVNYGTGATDIVSLRTFWWTTQIGLLPGTMVFVFAGTRIPALSTIAEQGVIALLDQALIAALIATCVLPVFIRWIAVLIQRRFEMTRLTARPGMEN